MSDYPMLISNKLHSFRNFKMQSYKISPYTSFFGGMRRFFYYLSIDISVTFPYFDSCMLFR